MLTSDVHLSNINHHANHARHRRPDPARSEGDTPEGRPINGRGRLRTARRRARPARIRDATDEIPLDLTSDEGARRSRGQGRRIRRARRRSDMSYSVDVNVLLYASDKSSDRHDAARQFLQSCASTPELLCLTWPTLMSYLRIATHSRIFAAPLSPAEALGNVTAPL